MKANNHRGWDKVEVNGMGRFVVHADIQCDLGNQQIREHLLANNFSMVTTTNGVQLKSARVQN